MKKLFVMAALMAGATGMALADDLEVTDTFDTDTNWNMSSYWRITDNGQMAGADEYGTFLPLKNRASCKNLTFEVDLTMQKAKAKTEKRAGLAVYVDDQNFWTFTLAEAADAKGAKHLLKLSEMRQGKWVVVKSGDCNWQYNQTYRLKLVMTPAGLSGQASDANGQVIGSETAPIAADSITCGIPALRVMGMIAQFDNAKISGK